MVNLMPRVCTDRYLVRLGNDNSDFSFSLKRHAMIYYHYLHSKHCVKYCSLIQLNKNTVTQRKVEPFFCLIVNNSLKRQPTNTRDHGKYSRLFLFGLWCPHRWRTLTFREFTHV